MQQSQRKKIDEIVEELVKSGFRTLDHQADVLGLPRSTTWTIVTGRHKTSGLTAKTINLMLRSKDLPKAVRVKIHEYIIEKAAGGYGHDKGQLRRFKSQLNGNFESLTSPSNMLQSKKASAGR